MVMPASIESFVEELRRTGRRRVDLATYRAAFLRVDPEAASAINGREYILEMLKAAERAGYLVCAKSIEDSAWPHLPRSVMLSPESQALAQKATLRPVWPAGLSWAADLRLTEEERELLEQVRLFLRDLRPDEPVVPIRERSLQITGHEKRLEGLLRGRLFLSGRLGTEVLKCRPVHPPFVYKAVGDYPTMLVVENHNTFYSLCQTLGSEDGVGFLAYGAGNQFTASVTYVEDLHQVEHVYYYGDLDVEGLLIPVNASRVAREANLPAVEPAVGFYRELIAFGPTGSASRKPTPSAVRQAAGWLPEELREPAVSVLAAGLRTAQEAIGLRIFLDADARRRVLEKIRIPETA